MDDLTNCRVCGSDDLDEPVTQNGATGVRCNDCEARHARFEPDGRWRWAAYDAQAQANYEAQAATVRDEWTE